MKKTISKTTYFILCIIISLISLSVISLLSKFKVSGFDGVIYMIAITPFLGVVFYIASVRFAIYGYSIILLFLLVQTSLFSAIHYYMINVYRIGGDYFLENPESYRAMSKIELFENLVSRNTNISGGAWDELKSRYLNEYNILFEMLDFLKERKAPGYIENYFVIRTVEIYSKHKDERIKSYLYEMLESNESILVTENNKEYYFYPTRNTAIKLLKQYFNEDVNVATRKYIQ